MQLKSLLYSVLTLALLAGCGGGDPAGSAQAVSKSAESARCLTCHGPATSPGTGALIVDEWRASTHNLNNGAGCADCHEPPADHPQESCSACHGGSSAQVTKNADAAGKCLKCHGPSHPADLLMAKAPQHFGYSTATALPQATRASYVSGQYQGRCRACHNPHLNTVTQQHRDYATSKHGDPKGVAWTSRDFKQGKDCIRCHTSTGFISFVTSGFTPPSAGFGAGDATRELIACDACHSSYDFKNSVRPVAAFTAPYTVAGHAVSFPDTGTSNLCIPCHAGRTSADDIAAVADFNFASFVNPHYRAAAGLMYMTIGFKEFTTASAPVNPNAAASSRYTYGDSYTMFTGPATPAAPPGQVNSAHRRFGTPLINGDNHVAPTRGLLAAWLPGTMDTGGPCVTCHLNAADSNGVLSTNHRTTSHTLAINENTWNQVCINCHSSEGPVTTFLEENSADFQHALALAQQLLLIKYNVAYSTTSPYFYDLNVDPAGRVAVKDWTRRTGDQTFGRRMMGACFNVNLLIREPAAYVHARTYARRLIYDTIDFLDDGIINMSVGATALGPIGQSILDENGNPVYVKGATTATSSSSFTYLCNLTQPERK